MRVDKRFYQKVHISFQKLSARHANISDRSALYHLPPKLINNGQRRQEEVFFCKFMFKMPNRREAEFSRYSGNQDKNYDLGRAYYQTFVKKGIIGGKGQTAIFLTGIMMVRLCLKS